MTADGGIDVNVVELMSYFEHGNHQTLSLDKLHHDDVVVAGGSSFCHIATLYYLLFAVFVATKQRLLVSSFSS
jgi:hypothetical protein